MSIRAVELTKILEELPLTGSLIQQVVQPDYPNLFFQLHRPGETFWLRICLSPGLSRIHQTWQGPKKPKKTQRFAEFLRSRLKGGKIVSVKQVLGDRIVELTVHRGEEVTRCIVRLWGGASNFLVTDESYQILDTQYRRPGKLEVSGGTFSLPSDQNPTAVYEKFPLRQELLETTVPIKERNRSFNSCLDSWYRNKEQEQEYSDLKERVFRLLGARENALEGRLRGLLSREAEYDEEEKHQLWGELLKNQAKNLPLRGEEVEVEDWWNPGTTVHIPLDPRRTVQENAERYFHLAKRARNGRERMNEERENLRRQLEEVQYNLLEVEENCDLPRLSEMYARVSQRLSIPTGKENKTDTETPGLVFSSGGFTFLVGRTAKENDYLLRRVTRGNDLWFHTRDYPGGYVFIRTQKGKSIPLEVLLDAGTLALFYSKARNNGSADLYYTQVKYLRRPKDGKLGLVLPTQEKNLSIKLDKGRIDRLFSSGRSNS
ncbi:MAG: fibronectin-binding domain-containing protein [Spirochaetales bacterium]|nr:fibronectin-binding domain-containing protein [Spirochaetales bacterium]